MAQFQWKLNRRDKANVESLKAVLELPELIMSILTGRGADTFEKAMEFIQPYPYGLYSPFYFKDMVKTIERIEKAIADKEAILIFGDRDVDGMTATAILYRYLQKRGANVVYRVPEGEEKYGVSKDVIYWAVDNMITLIVTVDCGITAIDEIDYATKMKIDVIVTDHHEPRETIPRAYSVINPMIESDGYPFQRLCGAGVVLKLVQGMIEHSELVGYYNEEIVFLDLETTGLNPGLDDIIEIGAVNVKNGVELSRFGCLVKTAKDIPAEIVNLTGITKEMTEKEGLDPADALKKLVDFIGNKKLVGHNLVGFDMRFLEVQLKKRLSVALANPVDDTLKMSKVMLKKLKDHKLLTVAHGLGVYADARTMHRSVQDCLVSAEVYRRLVVGRNAKIDELYKEYLPLVAIGTIADIMPLAGENRNIVKNGIKNIPYTVTGLISLIREIGVDFESINAKAIGWNIAPFLNSPGRIGDASLSVELLITTKLNDATDIAHEIIQKDKERKELVFTTMERILKDAKDTFESGDKFLLMASDRYVKGINGLIAHRLATEYQLPAMVIAIDGNEATGSVRVTSEFSVIKLLESLSDVFDQFGGHKYAGGFSMKASKIDELRDRIKKYMREYEHSDLMEELNIDAELTDFDGINLNMLKYIENVMEPVGHGNEHPKFLVRGVEITGSKTMGKDASHAILSAKKSGKELNLIVWNYSKFPELAGLKNGFYDMVCFPEINRYQGSEEARLVLLDIKQDGHGKVE